MLDQNDPARADIVARAKRLYFPGNPDYAAHYLGRITLLGGHVAKAWVIHAADPVITDGKNVVLINRKNPPAAGLPSLPGGMLDPLPDGTVEDVIRASAREALEEAGIQIKDVKGHPIGMRNMDRPQDVRVAVNNDLKKYGIRQGDVFMVSTQAVLFDIPNLAAVALRAGSDAERNSARLVPIADLTRDNMGIPDHYDMIREAVPEAFESTKSCKARPGNPTLTL